MKMLLRVIVLTLKALFGKSGSCCRILLLLLLLTKQGQAQRVISMQEMLDSAVLNSPMLKAAQSTVTQQKHLLKSSINLPNPEILIQNPTGKFYTAGVQQNFDFPTVYGVQRSLQKSNIKLAEASYQLTAAEIKYQSSILYVELQLQMRLLDLYRVQDSVFSGITKTADALFKAGQIDFLEQNYARVQAAEIHNNLVLAEASVKGLKGRLKAISGISTDFDVDTVQFGTTHIEASNPGMLGNPAVKYREQLVRVSEKELQLARQRVIPGFTIAYLNQAEKTTAFENRFYAGIRIPLWFWQYSGTIQAAKSQVEARKQEAYAGNLTLNAELEEAFLKHQAYTSSLERYNKQTLGDIQGILKASPRMLKAGTRSYLEHLKITGDAITMQRTYWETLRNYLQSDIYLHYLSGTIK